MRRLYPALGETIVTVSVRRCLRRSAPLEWSIPIPTFPPFHPIALGGRRLGRPDVRTPSRLRDDVPMRPVTNPGAGEAFAPIAEYGFFSDTETTALVAPSGNIEWMCLPRMDSPSVFGSLLDRDAGYFGWGPAGGEGPAARRYIPGTMVLETTWWTPGGWLVVLDALLMGPWHHEDQRSHTHRRAPTDYDADHVLLRIIRCVNGQVQARIDCLPMFDYGRAGASWEHTGSGYH